MATSNIWSSSEKNAIARLDHVVDALARRQGWQLAVRNLADALFWGLVISALVVLGIRLAGQSLALAPVTFVLIFFALSIGAVLAWRQNPGKLGAAIKADEQLGLKQRLSTAWEFRQTQPDNPVTYALANQAVGRRHATVTSVFPIELNLLGMLTPLAAALLLFASFIDLQGQVSTPVVKLDGLLLEEGARLKVFAERMKLRAERDDLERSLREAAGIQKLATEMQSGAMQREQALKRLASTERSLANQRSAALQELVRIPDGERLSRANQAQSNTSANSDDQSDMQPASTDSQSTLTLDQIQGLGLSTLRERLSAGELIDSDLDALERAAKALSEYRNDTASWGEELSQALEQYADGDASELRQVLDSLIESEQLLRDAEQLDNAREAVSRASENLGGESLLETNRVRAGDAAANEAGDADNLVNGDGTAGFPDMQLTAGDGLGRSQSKFEVLRQADQVARDTSTDTAVTLKPESKTSAGESFKSETWALPKTGNVTEKNSEVDARFKQQLEAVQAKESYPLHRKEFLRRYFLNLSKVVDDQEITGDKK